MQRKYHYLSEETDFTGITTIYGIVREEDVEENIWTKEK
jgi:hypothetical protein